MIERKCDWKLIRHSFFHLPGLQLIKHYRLLRKLTKAMNELKSADDFTKPMDSWIDTFSSLENTVAVPIERRRSIKF